VGRGAISDTRKLRSGRREILRSKYAKRKVMFGSNGEVIRYVRDLLLMVWEDLPVKMK
jgi:hypothetical protein